MPQIRLLKKGFDNFTGFIGQVEFENGLSVESVSAREAARFGAAFPCETVDGEQVGPSARLTQMKHEGARQLESHAVVPETPPTPESETDKAEAEAEGFFEQPEEDVEIEVETVEATEEAAEVVEEKAPSAGHTFESLAAVADKKGIAGLREVGAEMGVKGRSVNDLIDAILKKQAEKQKSE